MSGRFPARRRNAPVNFALAGNMITQPQLGRLAALVAATGAIIFGCLTGYARYDAHSAQAAVQIWHANWTTANVECEKDRTSVYCESIARSRKEFDEAVAFRNKRDEDTRTYFALSVAIPILSAFLFFGGRWIATGRVRSGAKP